MTAGTAAAVVRDLEGLQSATSSSRSASASPPTSRRSACAWATCSPPRRRTPTSTLREVDRLLDHPAYEPRMAAMCILDFKARRQLDAAGAPRARLALPPPPRSHHDVGHGRPVGPTRARRPPRRPVNGAARRPRGVTRPVAPAIGDHRAAVLRRRGERRRPRGGVRAGGRAWPAIPSRWSTTPSGSSSSTPATRDPDALAWVPRHPCRGDAATGPPAGDREARPQRLSEPSETVSWLVGAPHARRSRRITSGCTNERRLVSRGRRARRRASSWRSSGSSPRSSPGGDPPGCRRPAR